MEFRIPLHKFLLAIIDGHFNSAVAVVLSQGNTNCMEHQLISARSYRHT